MKAPNNKGALRFVSAVSAVVASFGLMAFIGWLASIPLLASFWAGGIPMAPSTALFFLLYGIALPLRIRFTGGPGMRLGHLFGWIGTALSAVLLLLSLRGVHSAVEFLGLPVSGTMQGVPFGHMSPMTAFCFLVVGCSFLLLSEEHRLRTMISFWSAASVVLMALLLVVGYLVGAPLLYGTGAIPPAMTTSLAFLSLGVALTWSAGLYLWPRTEQEIAAGGRQTAILILVFLLLATGILGAGYLSSRQQQKNFRSRVESELSAMADLKTNELKVWREERLADGELFYKNIVFSGLVRQFLGNPDDNTAREQIGVWLGHLVSAAQYRKVSLMDAEGAKRFVVPDRKEKGSVLDAMHDVHALGIRRPSFLDFHRDNPEGPVHLDVVVPILAEPGWRDILGYLIIEIDPEVYLYPMIRAWPTPSFSAEALIVRREGNDAVYLNNLRFRDNAALALRLPLSRVDLPAAKAVLGKTGIVEGKDYRGVPVVAALRAVPDSPWFLVARMDSEEIYRPLRERLLVTAGLVCAILLGSGLAVGFIWRNQRVGFYRLRYQAAREVEESGRRLRLVFENTKDGIMVADAETRRIVVANKAICGMLGYSSEKLLSLGVEDLHPADALPAIFDAFARLVRGEDSFAPAMPMLRRDGTVFFADVNTALLEMQGRPCLLGTFRDISERMRNEARIDHLNRVLRSLRNINQLIVRAESVSELIEKACTLLVRYQSYVSAMIVLIDENGTPIAHAESGVGEEFRPLAERIGKGELPSCCKAAEQKRGVCLICGGDDVCAPCPLAPMGNSPNKMSISLQHQDRVHGFLTVCAGGNISMDHEEESLFMELAGDLSYSLHNMALQRAMQQGEDARKKLEAQFFQAQKMESVGRLAGGVAHDFNNLLSIIIGYAQLLEEEHGDADAFKEAVGEIYEAAVRAKDLTRQLLAFSRKQILEMHVVDINRVITDFEKLMRRTIGEDIRVDLSLSQEPLPVKADASQIEQVLLNLAVNARDAMPDGGFLTVETVGVDLDETYAAERPGVVPGAYAMIGISDSGTGMDQETMKRIFEPFYTTKSLGKGTGLGLSTVYGIVKQHGGNIWVYSEIGRGTTFKIYLPLVDQEPALRERKREIAPLPVEAVTVMVVEDEVSLRKLSCRILERNGYKVLEAGDAAHAVEIAGRSTEPIDLLLTDVIMPNMKGTEVYAKIREVFPDLKVLYMSGYTDNVIARQGVLKDGVHFIQKPFTAVSLMEKLAEVLKS